MSLVMIACLVMAAIGVVIAAIAVAEAYDYKHMFIDERLRADQLFADLAKSQRNVFTLKRLIKTLTSQPNTKETKND